MLRQWSGLLIHAFTTARGVGNPLAMFSPAEAQLKPTALILAAKSEPWLNVSLATITFVQP